MTQNIRMPHISLAASCTLCIPHPPVNTFSFFYIRKFICKIYNFGINSLLFIITRTQIQRQKEVA